MNAVLAWLTDGANWQGYDGILAAAVGARLVLRGGAGASPPLVAIPLGLWVGHTGRGRFVAVNLTGALRAVPSLGLLFASLMVLGPRLTGEAGVIVPTELVLVVLAIPPILAGAYAGRGAGRRRGPGRRPRHGDARPRGAVARSRCPCALPLIASGLRSAALQVVATATLAATVGLGGLGRFLIDGLAVRDYAQMAGGAVLVAVLALLVDLAAATLQRVGGLPWADRQDCAANQPAAQAADATCVLTKGNHMKRTPS